MSTSCKHGVISQPHSKLSSIVIVCRDGLEPEEIVWARNKIKINWPTPSYSLNPECTHPCTLISSKKKRRKKERNVGGNLKGTG